MLLQHPAKLGVLRGDVGELLERGERLLDLPDLLHALRVFDEVLLRFGDEAFRRIQFGELQVGRLPAGGVAKHFVTHRNRVVVEPELGVLVDGAVVIVRRLGGVLHLEVQITHAIEDGQVGVGLPIFLLRL